MPEEIRIRIPDKVEKVLSALHQAGFEAYAVGGCVRDSILGRTPDDWDITTNALPGQVKQVFRRTIDTGIEHGTVTVRFEGESFEVTTYRLDGKCGSVRRAVGSAGSGCALRRKPQGTIR